MKAEALLSLIPDELLHKLAVDSGVNYYAKKLQGEVIFKLLLYCMVTSKDNSLRSMESTYERVTFQLLNLQYNKGTVRYSSISERLANIAPSYFESIFKSCVEAYKADIGKDAENLIRFDSTIVALSSSLLQTGYHLKGGDAENLRQLKFTIGYRDIPEIVHFFYEQKYTSENTALRESIIEQAAKETETVKVFDKGITARKTYDEFTQNNIRFVTRLNTGARKDVIENHDDTAFPVATGTLTILSDTWCYLYDNKDQKTKYPLRRIEAIRKDNNASIVFLSNIKDMSAVEITEIYRKRWDIEVFFKFIKQLLNFNHLLNRSENGIKVVLYVTMIVAVLIIAYRKTNKMQGFKIVKLKLEIELENALLKDIITLAGGNPELLQAILLKKGP